MEAYIADIVPMSTTHWPGQISTVIKFAGCDFKCPFCYSSDITKFKEEFKKLLKDVKQQLVLNTQFIDSVLFTGGECTLQRMQLVLLARFAKDLNLKVGIETNGSQTNALKSLIREGIVDMIKLDLKAPLQISIFEQTTKSKTYFKTTEAVIKNMEKTLQLLKENEDEFEIIVSTTIVPNLMYKEHHLLLIRDLIKKLDCKWQIQQFVRDKEKIKSKKFQKEKPMSSIYLHSLKQFLQKNAPELKIIIKE